eukprot:TRINITY_DN4594_c0_g1_i7.p1 TRINITY_DN4594_c0_g1~~TRINITY_DN4594_c0_g1_i7.p1  ORF type:complete len:303 (+),score=71.09 TRINITY_DN4594_c0_g1_i7:142-1050(+)
MCIRDRDLMGKVVVCQEGGISVPAKARLAERHGASAILVAMSPSDGRSPAPREAGQCCVGIPVVVLGEQGGHDIQHWTRSCKTSVVRCSIAPSPSPPTAARLRLRLDRSRLGPNLPYIDDAAQRLPFWDLMLELAVRADISQIWPVDRLVDLASVELWAEMGGAETRTASAQSTGILATVSSTVNEIKNAIPRLRLPFGSDSDEETVAAHLEDVARADGQNALEMTVYITAGEHEDVRGELATVASALLDAESGLRQCRMMSGVDPGTEFGLEFYYRDHLPQVCSRFEQHLFEILQNVCEEH